MGGFRFPGILLRGDGLECTLVKVANPITMIYAILPVSLSLSTLYFNWIYLPLLRSPSSTTITLPRETKINFFQGLGNYMISRIFKSRHLQGQIVLRVATH